MPGGVFKDIKDFIKSGNMVNKLIVLNLLIGIGLVVILLFSGNMAYDRNILKYFLLSSNFYADVYHPWTLFTHLFISIGILHFIVNMLFLYWFGNIIGDMIGDSKILPLYILSGLAGAILFILLSYFFPLAIETYISGVDSIIIGFAIASAVLVPDFSIRLILVGHVRLKILVIIFVIIEFLYAISSNNTIYFSYIGAGFFGWFYIYSIKRGRDISKPVNAFIIKLLNLFSYNKNQQNRNISVKYKSKSSSGIKTKVRKDINQAELDRILDKIRASGYDSLTAEEKEFLFLASKKE